MQEILENWIFSPPAEYNVLKILKRVIFVKIFLAANSAEGFISHFGNCYDPSEGWRAYIIKGGPGTGKSSFMKRVKARAEEQGEHIVEVFCASDPTSLDGLILQNKKLVFIDGTAPHVVEPRLPGVCENLLDFGRFWNADRLALKREEITAATEKNKACHRRAAELIKSAGGFLPIPDFFPNAGRELINKRIPEKGGKGRITRAFLGGITPGGVQYFDKSADCGTTLIFGGRDADAALKNFAKEAAARGFNCFLFENPIRPSLTDGVLIPELSFFVKKDRFMPENEELKALLEKASEEISRAKLIHDELEAFYISAMDFAALNSFAETFLQSL